MSGSSADWENPRNGNRPESKSACPCFPERLLTRLRDARPEAWTSGLPTVTEEGQFTEGRDTSRGRDAGPNEPVRPRISWGATTNAYHLLRRKNEEIKAIGRPDLMKALEVLHNLEPCSSCPSRDGRDGQGPLAGGSDEKSRFLWRPQPARLGPCLWRDVSRLDRPPVAEVENLRLLPLQPRYGQRGPDHLPTSRRPSGCQRAMKVGAPPPATSPSP